MSTKQRLGIDITATNKTAAAFASVQKSVSGIQSNLQSLKFLMAGFVSGNFLEGMVRSFVEVSKQSAPVKTALDNLNRAWTGFAQKVVESGLDQALINFANRMGALILSTDGLAASIGGFMNGAITVMAYTFEGVGRAIGFAYDNAEIFGRLLASMALLVVARQVMGLAAGFYFFAKTVRQTGLIMTAFHAISRANLLVFLALATGIAYATDSVDRLKAGIDMMWKKVQEVFPAIASAGTSMAESLGFDMSALSTDLANATTYINKLGTVEMPKMQTSATGAAEKVKHLGEATRNMGSSMMTATSSVQEIGNSLQDVAGSFSQNMSSAFSSVVSGTANVQDAFGQMAQGIVQTLSDLAAKLAINAGLKLLLSLVSGGMGGMFGGGAGLNLGGMVFGGLFANGGRLGAGQWGIAGEAGPEIVHGPAQITPINGAGAVNVTVINNSSAQVNTSRRADGSIEIMIEELANQLARGGGKIDAALQRGYGLRRAGR